MIVAISFGLTLLVSLLVLALQPSEHDVYRKAPAIVASVATFIGSILIGAWVFGMEFGQGTLRRTLAIEPRRGVLLVAKGVIVVAAAAAFAAVTMTFAVVLTVLITSAASIEFDVSVAFKLVPSMAIQGVLVALMAAGFTLLFRSYNGGQIATFAMVFVVDGIIGLWEPIRDYTFGVSLSSIDAIFDSEPTVPAHPLAATVLIALAWVTAFAVPGVVRFLRGDFK